MFYKDEFGFKNWEKELIDFLTTSLLPQQARSIVKNAQLEPQKYEKIYKFLRQPLGFCFSIDSSWQLELLSGEKKYYEQHFFKKDNRNYSIAHYAVASPAVIEILEEIRKRTPDLLKDPTPSFTLLDLSIFFKNGKMLEWILKEMPPTKIPRNLYTHLEHSEWEEGYQLLAKQNDEFCKQISLDIFPLYKWPALLELCKEKKIFPYKIEYIKSLNAMYLKKKENHHDITLWIIKNIPDFIKHISVFNPFDQNMLHVAVTCNYNQFVKNIICYSPILLDLKDYNDCSISWMILKHLGKKSFNELFTLKQNCTVLDGIHINVDCRETNLYSDSSSSSGDEERQNEMNKMIEEMLNLLSAVLSDNYTIQTLYFTDSTKVLISEYLNKNKAPPIECYLERNKQLLQMSILILGINDKESSLCSNLSIDVLSIIMNKLINLYTLPINEPTLSANSLNFFKHHKETAVLQKREVLATDNLIGLNQ